VSSNVHDLTLVNIKLRLPALCPFCSDAKSFCRFSQSWTSESSQNTLVSSVGLLNYR